MELEKFKTQLSILDKKTSEQIRDEYLSIFINTKSPWYEANIGRPFLCSDGICYLGYIWGALKAARKIPENSLFKELKKKSMILVMWDVNSQDYIRIPDYWKFPKSAVVQLDASLLIENLKFFPEDIYIFDRTFQWSLILTHEVADLKQGKRLCFALKHTSDTHLLK